MSPSVADLTPHDSYDPAFFQALFEVEDTHFWFRSRNQVIAKTVERLVAGLAPGYQVLEVGCGTGNVLKVLKDVCSGGTVIGMDLFAQGLDFARQRTAAALVQGDIHQPPFGDRQFNIIGLFDVLEHLPDDMQVLRDLHGMLTNHGVLVLTVPAHPTLWSYFDEASHHCRRYSLSELNSKLIESGYRVEYLSQYMMTIFPVVWLGRRLGGLRKRHFDSRNDTQLEDLALQELRPFPAFNEVVTLLLGIEVRWMAQGHALPLGTSMLAVARKLE